jgi:hypothetical protein
MRTKMVIPTPCFLIAACQQKTAPAAEPITVQQTTTDSQS